MTENEGKYKTEKAIGPEPPSDELRREKEQNKM